MSNSSAARPRDRHAARRVEIAANLAAVRSRIDAACAAAGRATSDITLIAVTKTFPATDVEVLAELGVTDVGENRDQEAVAKVAALRDHWGTPANERLRWHFIGALQTNKCASVVRYASVVHSVDRLRLVEALGAAVVHRPTPLACLVQVDLDDSPKPGRGGARPVDVPAVADAIATTSGLVLAGVMAIAPLGAQPDRAFAALSAVASALWRTHPEAAVVSAGMSADLEAAVTNGATHLRVGAALLGSRGHPG